MPYNATLLCAIAGAATATLPATIYKCVFLNKSETAFFFEIIQYVSSVMNCKFVELFGSPPALRTVVLRGRQYDKVTSFSAFVRSMLQRRQRATDGDGSSREDVYGRGVRVVR